MTGSLVREGGRSASAAGVVERRLSLIISITSLLWVLAWAVTGQRADDHGHPLWWEAVQFSLIGAIVLLAAAGGVLPDRVLVVLWTAIPIGVAALALTTFVPADGATSVDPEFWPWPWALISAGSGYVTIIAPPRWAYATPAILGVLPGLSALLVLGHIPFTLAWAMPILMTNIGFTVVFLGLRSRLNQLHESELDVREAEARRLRSAAEVERRQALATLVHDQVLSVFTAAMNLRGVPPAELRGEAGGTLRLLDSFIADTGPTTTPNPAERVPCDMLTTEAAELLVNAWYAQDPEARISVETLPGVLPSRVVDAIQLATAEALRNSLRHAGPEAVRAITARLEAGRPCAVPGASLDGYRLRAAERGTAVWRRFGGAAS